MTILFSSRHFRGGPKSIPPQESGRQVPGAWTLCGAEGMKLVWCQGRNCFHWAGRQAIASILHTQKGGKGVDNTDHGDFLFACLMRQQGVRIWGKFTHETVLRGSMRVCKELQRASQTWATLVLLEDRSRGQSENDDTCQDPK